MFLSRAANPRIFRLELRVLTVERNSTGMLALNPADVLKEKLTKRRS